MGKMSELNIEKMNEAFYTDDKGVIHKIYLGTDKSNLGNPDHFNCKCGSVLKPLQFVSNMTNKIKRHYETEKHKKSSCWCAGSTGLEYENHIQLKEYVWDNYGVLHETPTHLLPFISDSDSDSDTSTNGSNPPASYIQYKEDKHYVEIEVCDGKSWEQWTYQYEKQINELEKEIEKLMQEIKGLKKDNATYKDLIGKYVADAISWNKLSKDLEKTNYFKDNNGNDFVEYILSLEKKVEELEKAK